MCTRHTRSSVRTAPRAATHPRAAVPQQPTVFNIPGLHLIGDAAQLRVTGVPVRRYRCNVLELNAGTGRAAAATPHRAVERRCAAAAPVEAVPWRAVRRLTVRSQAYRARFLPGEDLLILFGLGHYWTHWDAIQRDFVPAKLPRQARPAHRVPAPHIAADQGPVRQHAGVAQPGGRRQSIPVDSSGALLAKRRACHAAQGQSIAQFRERWLLPQLQDDPSCDDQQLRPARTSTKRVSFITPTKTAALPTVPAPAAEATWSRRVQCKTLCLSQCTCREDDRAVLLFGRAHGDAAAVWMQFHQQHPSTTARTPAEVQAHVIPYASFIGAVAGAVRPPGGAAAGTQGGAGRRKLSALSCLRCGCGSLA